MIIHFAAALLSLHLAAVDTVPTPAAVPADAYLDAGARELVSRGRARRETVDHSIIQYRTVARDRISVGLRAVRRDRQVLLRETAARILWRRDAPGEIEMLGARQAMPMFSSTVRVADGARGSGAFLAFDPSDQDLIRATFGDGDQSIRHPLAAGSEANYRFRSGDTTSMRLPDGRTLRLIELRVIPRRQEFYLADGSLWLDSDTHAVVRAVVRPARPWDIDLDGDEDSSDVPGIVKPIRAEIRYMTIEYGLWDLRWWMPRILAFEGFAEVGALGGVGSVLRYERTYSEYSVTGDARGSEPAEAAAVLTECPKRDRNDPDRLVCRCSGGRCHQFAVRLPADTASLVDSEYLPPSIYVDGNSLITDAEMRELREMLERMQPPVWSLVRPTVRWSVANQDLLRYNRVEGLSVGARADVDFGAIAADGTLRVGVADFEPDVQLGVARQTVRGRYRVAGYHRLAAVDVAQRPFGLGNSLSALFLGRDEGDFFRATGAELAGTPPRTEQQWYRWRVFAEQQRQVVKNTDFSVPHLFDGARDFRPNLPAERADQFGAALDFALHRGLDPAGLRWAADLFVEGAAGTFGYVRPSLALSASAPLPGRFVGALEVAGGTSFGDLPAQSAWYLGGSGSVRGYAPLTAGGTAFWRTRAEVSNQLPGARWVLFSDAGWAGARDDVRFDPLLVSAGAGASFLDGLVRFDLARSLRGERQWRAELYLNGAL